MRCSWRCCAALLLACLCLWRTCQTQTCVPPFHYANSTVEYDPQSFNPPLDACCWYNATCCFDPATGAPDKSLLTTILGEQQQLARSLTPACYLEASKFFCFLCSPFSGAFVDNAQSPPAVAVCADACDALAARCTPADRSILLRRKAAADSAVEVCVDLFALFGYAAVPVAAVAGARCFVGPPSDLVAAASGVCLPPPTQRADGCEPAVDACSFRGICRAGVCQCDADFYGAHCQHYCNAEKCSGNGQCNAAGGCDCDDCWAGDDCSDWQAAHCSLTVAGALLVAAVVGCGSAALLACLVLLAHGRLRRLTPSADSVGVYNFKPLREGAAADSEEDNSL